MGAGVGRFYHFLIASSAPDDQVGYFSTSERSYAFVDYIAWPIRLVLFPAFSKIDFTSQPESLKKTLKYAVKYSSLIILPIIALLAVLAHPLILVLFGAEYEYSWVYLSLLSIFAMYYGLGSAHFHKLFMGQGETKFVAKLEAMSALIGITLATILIPRFQIFGYIILDVMVVWPAYFLMVRKARKDYGISVPLGAVWKIYIATIVTGVVAFFSSSLVANDLLKLVLGGLVGSAAYILTLLAISGVNLTDIENLKEMAKDQPAIGSLLRQLLNLIEKIYLRFHPDATT
jgi:O-antigen/teichoic acid export membrane protein